MCNLGSSGAVTCGRTARRRRSLAKAIWLPVIVEVEEGAEMEKDKKDRAVEVDARIMRWRKSLSVFMQFKGTYRSVLQWRITFLLW